MYAQTPSDDFIDRQYFVDIVNTLLPSGAEVGPAELAGGSVCAGPERARALCRRRRAVAANRDAPPPAVVTPSGLRIKSVATWTLV
jgi:hypothetical protein